MAGLFSTTGAAEFWGEMVNCSGSNVLLRIMKMTKKHEKWLIYKLKGFLFFFRGDDVIDVRGDVGKWGRRYAVSGKREVPAPLLVEGGFYRRGSNSIG